MLARYNHNRFARLSFSCVLEDLHWFYGDVSERRIYESRTDKLALITCLKKLNASDACLTLELGSQFPLRDTQSTNPENPRNLLENYNLAHPRPVLKVAENH